MTIGQHSSADSPPSRGATTRRLSRLAAAALIVAVPVAGCGGSSSKSSSAASTPSATAPAAVSSTTAAASQPLTKAAYENKLGPLFNDQVDPALKTALSNGGATNPQKLADVIGLLQTAHDAMAAVSPPTAVADLNQKAVTVLGSLITDVTNMRDALTSSNKSGLKTAAQAVVSDARQIQTVGSQFVSRGY